MTEISMSVREYLRKAGIDLDGDFLAQAAALVAQATMELEVTQQIGAAKHERTPARQTQRNGYRERNWATRVGDIPLRIPKLRQGSYFPSLLEPRRRAEQALLAVVQQAYIEGVSTRVNIGMKCPRIIALKCPLISIGNVRSELRHRRRSSRACGYVGNSERSGELSIYPQARRAGPQRAATSSTSSSVGFGRPSSPARRFSLSR